MADAVGRTLALLLALAVLACPAHAKAPTASPRPEPRPVAAAPTLAFGPVVPSVGAIATPRRAPLPVRVVTGAAPGAALAGLKRSPRPEARPANLQRRTTLAQVAFRAPPVAATGAICGDRAIRGQVLAPIPGRIEGCGVDAPVQVTEISGIGLSQAAVMDCVTARALKTWLTRSAVPVVGRLGGGIDRLRVAAHYSCRTRNSQAGAKISEHGKGHAIDISAIRLKNGVAITVLDGWHKRLHGWLLRRLHADACGPFGTVLGPESDRFHRDHFHFDTARYRSGSYCR